MGRTTFEKCSTAPARTSEISLNHTDRSRPTTIGGPAPEEGRRPGVTSGLASVNSGKYKAREKRSEPSNFGSLPETGLSCYMAPVQTNDRDMELSTLRGHGPSPPGEDPS